MPGPLRSLAVRAPTIVAAVLAAVLVAGIGAAVAGSDGGTSSSSGATGTPSGDRTSSTSGGLNAVVPVLNAARSTVLADAGQLAQIAGGIDAVAAAAASGDPDKVKGQRNVAPLLAQAHAVLERLPAELGAYTDALDRLTTTGRQLHDARRTAVTDIATRGRAEVTAVRGFLSAAGTALPAYDAFQPVEALWYERASDGWYRSTQEAAGAYSVLLDPVASRLAAAQRALSDADAALHQATKAASMALKRADVVFSRTGSNRQP